jgi:DNA-directed RNA polymerase specialized sigma24 family protein
MNAVATAPIASVASKDLLSPREGDAPITMAGVQFVMGVAERVCFRQGIKDPGRAQEVGSLVVEAVWRNFDRLKGRLETFVRRVAGRKCIDLCRRDRSRPACLGRGGKADCLAGLAARAPAETPAMVEAIHEGIEKVMAQMRVKYPEELEWWDAHYKQGRTIRDVAGSADRSYMAVYRGIRRINRELKKLLPGEAAGAVDSG